MARPGGSGPLGLRLALAFVAVALSAVALLAVATAVFAAADISHLADKQRAELTQAMTVAAAAAWGRADSWAGADLGPVLDLGGRIGVDVGVLDSAGRARRGLARLRPWQGQRQAGPGRRCVASESERSRCVSLVPG